MENLTLEKKIGLLDESDFRYRQLVFGLPVAVYTCDAQGYVKIYNKAAAKLWGREPEVGKDLWCGSWKIYNLDGSPMSLDTCPMAIALKEQRPVYGAEIIIERPDGVRRYVQPYPEPIFNESGELVEAVNTLIDITEQKTAELALERKVQERTSELTKTNHDLERSNSELEQFAYIASHDLQEPIRKINVFSAYVKNNIENPDKALFYLEKISASSDRMMKLIRELLSFSKLSRQNEGFTEVNLNHVLANIKRDLELAIREKNAVIKSDPLPVIQGIPLQLNQLFYNLVCNSLKFCKADVKPCVTITSRLLPADEIENYPSLLPQLTYYEIVIADNGIGFEDEHAEKIFTIFYRLNHQDNGTGIGLALCKKIAINHRGNIFAEAKENTGAKFHILLPARQTF